VEAFGGDGARRPPAAWWWTPVYVRRPHWTRYLPAEAMNQLDDLAPRRDWEAD
jgi:hypothetical protein